MTTNLFLNRTRWLHSAFCTLILLFSIGIGNAWGDTYTITFATGSGDGTKASTSTAASTCTTAKTYVTGNLETASNTYYKGSSGLKLGTSGNAGDIKFNLSAAGQVVPTKVSVYAKYYSSSKKKTVQVCTNLGSNTATTTTGNFAEYSYSYSGSEALSYIEIKSSGYIWVEKVVVTYIVDCTTNPTVSAGSNSLVTATTATVSCSSGISSLGSEGCSISSYGFVLGTSANPTIDNTVHEVGTSYTTTGTSFSKDLTGLSAETTYYVRPYATNGNGTAYGTQTSFTTPALPKYTVTLKDDNSTLIQASAGASVTLPSRTGCTGYTFAGWTKSWVAAQTEWTTTAPDIIPAGSYTPEADENLYPVYTKTEGGEEKETEIFATKSLGSTNTVTTGYAVSAAAEAKSGYYQDGSGTTRSVSVRKSSTATAMISSIPTIATVTAKLGGGSTKDPLKNNVYAVWLDESGNELGDAVQITSKITSATGSDFTANLPVANATSAYGVRIKHEKETSYNVRYYAISLSITTGGSTTSYISVPNCCTNLGSINGSVSLTQLATPDPTKLKASWTMNAETGIASYTLEVYDSSNNLVKAINKYTSGSEITGLTPCTEYYVKLYTVSSGGEYCAGGLIGTSSSVTTNGYTLTVNTSNVTLSSGSEPTNICSNISATYAASDGYTLPTSISVTNAGAENTGWTWNSSTGALTINKANVTGNVTVTITGAAQSNFINGETVFIQADSKDYSAWKDDACVKAWFNNNWSGGSAETTYWLFDATDADAGKKLFATVVPASGDLNIVQLQRFAGNCLNKWNDNGSVNKASSNGVNTFRSYGSADNNVAWNGSSTILYLYGSQNSWESSLGTFADQGAGVWTATISNYTPDATSKDYKIKTSYNNGWIGNTGSNNNATLSDMIVGSTYNVTATLNVTTHALTMSKTFVKGTVHFDLQGHGSAIADLTNVAAGSKISAPSPAPNETGWDFGGWYKEAECTNEWNFASDVVNETMTLYAKWTKTPVEELLLNYSELNKYVGDPAVTLEVSGVTPEGADPSVTWSSSNSSVASVVAATGVVTFGTVGTATITATSTVTGTTTAYCHVTVRNKPTATFVDLIHNGNGTDLSTYNLQNVAGTSIVFPTLSNTEPGAETCEDQHYIFVGWTTSDNNDDPQDHLVTSGALENDVDKTFYAVWADGKEGYSYTQLTSNSFESAPTKYVIGVKSSGTMYYFNSCAKTGDKNSWGYTTNDPTNNPPIQFTLSGTASELIATSTEATARYIVPMTTADFKMSTSSQTLTLNEDGTIHNTGTNNAYALRGNSANLRWYKSGTGNPAYFYKVESGSAVSYRTSCCANPLEAPSVTATNTAYTVTLTWGAVAGATGYEVSWNNGAWTAATSPVNKTSLTASTTYTYKVRATYDEAVHCGARVASGNVTTDDVYSVTYSGGTGTGSCSPTGSVATVTYEAGETVTLAATDSYNLTSNNFAAWVVKDAENNDVAVSNNQFTMPASNVTVTATWTAVQDKYYDRMHQSTDASHGGIADGNGKYYIVREGCNYTVPSPADDHTGDTDCHTTHFKLLGWIAQSYLKADGQIKPGAESYIFQGGGTKSAKGATYYAIWAIMTE